MYTAEMLIDDMVEVRKSQGLTQQDLADIVGLHRPNICRIESNGKVKIIPKLDTLLKVLDGLGHTLKIVPIEEH